MAEEDVTLPPDTPPGSGDRLGPLYNDSGGPTTDYDYNDTATTILYNFTAAPVNTTHLPGFGGNFSNDGATAERIEYCKEWPGATLTLFQVANFFCLLAFLVPHNFRLSGLVMRCILCIGILLFTLWAGLDVCAVDILAWNMSFLLVNSGHVLYLAYTFWPPRVHKDLFDLFDKVFRPLKVNRQHFRQLVKEASMKWLEAGEIYAVEDVTPADERLSILLTGKLRVTCDSTHLHYIHPNQFVDSPEWEACPDDSDELFQVSIVAEERSKILWWSRPRLRHVLQVRPFLRAVIYNLIGKDITTKLYSLNEQLGVSSAVGDGRSQDVWRGVVQRSMSLDTVHTGTKGFVRSLAWRASHRRTSGSIGDSARSSPGHSVGSHCSDPPPPREHPSPVPTIRTTPPPARSITPQQQRRQQQQQLQSYTHQAQMHQPQQIQQIQQIQSQQMQRLQHPLQPQKQALPQQRHSQIQPQQTQLSLQSQKQAYPQQKQSTQFQVLPQQRHPQIQPFSQQRNPTTSQIQPISQQKQSSFPQQRHPTSSQIQPISQQKQLFPQQKQSFPQQIQYPHRQQIQPQQRQTLQPQQRHQAQTTTIPFLPSQPQQESRGPESRGPKRQENSVRFHGLPGS